LKVNLKLRLKLCSIHTESSEAEARVSYDSMNSAVRSRNAGRESPDEPDFIAVKAGTQYGGDKALAIVEVKNSRGHSDGYVATEWEQVIRYANNISHKNPASDLKIYLVKGATTYVLELPSGGVVNPDFEKITTVPGLKSSLERIAESHWAV
jgi:hypothetical protein